jgi:hypothetical protein
LLRRKLKEEIGKVQVSASGEIAEADKKAIAEKLTSFLKSKSDEFGLDVLGVEIRKV